jgi:transposase
LLGAQSVQPTGPAFRHFQYPTSPLDAARTAAPQAIQVADRWHIWHNLAQHAEKTAARHAACIAGEPSAAAPIPEPMPATTVTAPTPVRSRAGKLAARVRQHHQQIHALAREGKAIKEIARELGLSRGTVRRFTRASTVDELLPDGHGPRTATPPPPKSRQIAHLILRHPDTLDDDETTALQQIRKSCPHLDRLAHHVTAFAKMLTGLHGKDLDAWIATVKADDQPELHSFVRGIEADYDAVRNGLTLSHNSGAVEGQVNRIKMIKRQMYGRANFDLLRLRVLLS